MSWFAPQNPGIDGVDELTPSEEALVMHINGLPYRTGDILWHNGTNFTNLSLANSNGFSFYTTGGSIVGSYTTGGGGQLNVSAGTTSNNLTNLVFSNSNGVSWGLNGSTVTATVKTDYPTTQSVQTQNLVSINGSTGDISFANANGITFGANASTITASHNGLTQQSTQPVAISGSNGSFNFSTASFGNLNGLSFYSTNGSMVGSYTVPTVTNSSITMQAGASTLSSVSRIAFVDSNGVSFGASTSNNGSITITATVKTDYLSSQSNQAVSGSNGSFTFQTITFGNLNGLSFYTSNGSLVGSYTDGGGGGVAVAGGTQTATSGTVLFNNANGITFGMSNSSVITASHNGLTTAAQSDHSHGNPTLNLTNLSGTTASASNGFTLSLSAANPGGGAGVTYKYFRPSNAEWVITAQGQGSYSVQYAALPNLEISRVNFPINFSGATNSTGQYTATILMGFYSKNVSTLSAAHTFSTAFVWTHSGTANSVSHAGPRILSLPWTTTIGASDYWIGIGYRTTSASADASFSVFALSQINSSISGFMKSASAASVGQFPMEGVYTATTAANPSSIHITQINGISSAMRRQPIFFLGGDS